MDFSAPTNLLCLSCGNLIPLEAVSETCPQCDESINVDELLRLYEYGAHAYYYGHQYRLAYEAQEKSKQTTRYYLEFAGEAFAWTMLAVLSGVIGNAAYDLIKKIVVNIRREVELGKLPARDYSALLDLSDDELGDLVNSAKCYANHFDGLTQEVRLAIVEEIAVDAMVHEPKLMAEITKIMKGRKAGAKQRKRFVELLRTVVAREQARIQPKRGRFDDVWARVDPRE